MPNIYSLLAQGIALLGAVLFALYASSRVLPSLLADPGLQSLASASRRPSQRGVVQIALAALLAMPLLDAIILLWDIPQLASAAAWRSVGATAQTAWGTAPWALYLLITDLLLIGSYATAFASMRGVPSSPQIIGSRASMPTWQRALLVSVLGALLFRLLKATVLQVVWLQFPLPSRADAGIPGFAVGWALGFVFLSVGLVLFGPGAGSNHAPSH